jgi:hypothetical protein
MTFSVPSIHLPGQLWFLLDRKEVKYFTHMYCIFVILNNYYTYNRLKQSTEKMEPNLQMGMTCILYARPKAVHREKKGKSQKIFACVRYQGTCREPFSSMGREECRRHDCPS